MPIPVRHTTTTTSRSTTRNRNVPPPISTASANRHPLRLGTRSRVAAEPLLVRRLKGSIWRVRKRRRGSGAAARGRHRDAAARSSLMSSSPNRRRVHTSSAITWASRLQAGAPSTALHNRSAATVPASHFGARGFGAGFTILLQRRGQRFAGAIAVPARGRAQLVEGSPPSSPCPHACTASRSSWSQPAVCSS